MAAVPDWLFTAAACLFGIAGALLLPWALLGDRSRGRRRCPKCWYDLAGVPGTTCPECGRTARRERRLARTRRRWRWALVAILLLIGAWISAVTPTARRHGWPRTIPNAVLIAALPGLETPMLIPNGRTVPSIRQRLFTELLEDRALAGRLPHWEMRWLIRKCTRTPDGMPSMMWRLFYGHVTERLIDEAEWARVSDDERSFRYASPFTPAIPAPAVALDDSEWEMLNRFRATQSVVCRSRWPSGVPLHVDLGSHWIQAPTRGRSLEIVPAFPGAERARRGAQARIVHVNYGEFRAWEEASVPLGVPPDGLRELVLNATLSESTRDDDAAQVWRGELRYPLVVGGTIDDVVKAVPVPALDAALQSELRPVIRVFEGAPTHLYVKLGFENDPGPAAHIYEALAANPGLTLAVRMELLRDSKRIASAEAWWTVVVDDRFGPMYMLPHWTIIQLDITDAAALNARDGAWSLRVSSHAETALRCQSATACWKGEVTVPAVWAAESDRW